MFVRVNIEVDDVLDELSDEDLREELHRRSLRCTGFNNTVAIPVGEARAALDEAATVMRKAGHYNLAYKLDEVREDYVASRNKPQFYRFKPEAAVVGIANA